VKDKTSMVYWFPKLKNIDQSNLTFKVKIPKTSNPIKLKWNLTDDWEAIILNNEDKLKRDIDKELKKFEFPIFMRTDQSSFKHDWEETCFVTKKEQIIPRIKDMIENSFCLGINGIPCNYIYFREYIEMDTMFHAFWHKTPINPEIRFFVKDGKVRCWHWYWVKDAIRNPSRPDWKELINKKKQEIYNEIIYNEIREILIPHAELVAREFKEGYFSVDYCRAKNHDWYVIDMAEGVKSWHPKH